MKRTLSLVALSIAPAACQTSYLAWMADSFILKGVVKDYHYSGATIYLGYEAAYNLTQNDTYHSWYKEQIDAVVLDNGTIDDWNYTKYSLDNYRMANNYLYWYEQTGEEKYKSAAQIVRDQLDRHPRTESGGFWHRDPDYPNQMWLDGIFMADTFYAKWTNWFDADNTTAWDDIVLQYDLIDAHCRNTTTQLLVHGYDESKSAVWADPATGAAPLVWDRADGWYFWSLLEVLQLVPPSHAGYGRLLGYFTSLAEALKASQDAAGGWWLIMSDPYAGAAGNYIESSGSSIFTFGWLRGMRLGFLGDEYLEPAKKGYGNLVDEFVIRNDNGTLSWNGTVSVGSLNSNGTYEYYISVPIAINDIKGVGAFMMASYEYESWASAA